MGGRTDSEAARGERRKCKKSKDRNRDGRWEDEAGCVRRCVCVSVRVHLVKAHRTRCGEERMKERNADSKV